MAKWRDNQPSPLRTGIVHAGLSLAVFGGLAAALGAGIQVVGDPSAARPSQTLALFETNGDARPVLKTRLKTELSDAALVAAMSTTGDLEGDTADEPDLGVEYAEAPTLIANLEQVDGEGSAELREGVRINGKLVRPGESFGEVTQIISLPTAPIAGLTETVNGKSLPRVAADGRAPAEAYARPFANPGNQPVVSLVIGGLGINATHTKSAIDELPPEVTLSFAPDANRLQYWITKARAAGHEVLIEVPMETFDYGRMKMHPQTLLAGDAGASNGTKLETLLSGATGYFGIINYQGAKFAADANALRPVFETLGQRGIAFVDDGSLQSPVVGKVADQSGLRYASASTPIDARLSAEEINTELMDLETLAKQNGAALGTGYAFPLTIEMAKTWTADLAEKGLVLAPASAQLAVTPEAMVEGGRVRTGSLAPTPLNPKG